MRIVEPIASCEPSSNLVLIGQDSTLKYSYIKPKRGQDAPLLKLMSPSK